MADLPIDSDEPSPPLDKIMAVEPPVSFIGSLFPEIKFGGIFDSDETKAEKHALVETNKSNVVLFVWLVLTIPAMWLNGDEGSMVLSIAAALVGLAFSQGENILEGSFKTKTGPYIMYVYCAVLPWIGGLVLGNTASAVSTADSESKSTAIAVTVLSSLLLVIIVISMAINRYDPAKAPTQESGEDVYRDIYGIDASIFIPMVISAVGSFCSLVLAIAGTVLTDADVEIGVRLGILGMAVAFGLLASILCTILDKAANGGPVVEFLIIFLALTVDVIPLAIELTIEEDEDNPKVMTIAAWVAFGTSSLFWVLAVISLYKAGELTKEDPVEKVPEAHTVPKQKSEVDYEKYQSALDAGLRERENLEDKKLFLVSRKYLLDQENKKLNDELEAVHKKLNLVAEKKADLGYTRDAPKPTSKPPPPPPVPETRPVPEPQLMYVQEGYYAEPGPDGRPVAPRFVKEGYYPRAGQPGMGRPPSGQPGMPPGQPGMPQQGGTGMGPGAAPMVPGSQPPMSTTGSQPPMSRAGSQPPMTGTGYQPQMPGTGSQQPPGMQLQSPTNNDDRDPGSGFRAGQGGFM